MTDGTIRTGWQLEDLQAAVGYDIVFEHSDQCDLSATAADILFEVIEGDAGAVRVWMLTVQDEPALSNRIARAFNVAHASPQVIVLKNGVPVEMRSHRGITREWLRRWVNQSLSVDT